MTLPRVSPYRIRWLRRGGAIFLLLLIFSLVVVLGFGEAGAEEPVPLQTADIIFQTSLSSQSKAVQAATHSRYSHMGLLVWRGKELMVLEASKTVTFTPFREWVKRGKNAAFVVKRLRNPALLDGSQRARFEKIAEEYLGKPYDPYFEWSDERIYCSELVWKIYQRALGLTLGSLQKFQEFDLSNAAVKQLMRKRFGKDFPRDEPAISPARIFESELLQEVSASPGTS